LIESEHNLCRARAMGITLITLQTSDDLDGEGSLIYMMP
jgi:hypothetical protein